MRLHRAQALLALAVSACVPGQGDAGAAAPTPANGQVFLPPDVLCAGRWTPQTFAVLFTVGRRTGSGENSAGELVVYDAKHPEGEGVFKMTMPLQMPLACFPAEGSGHLVTVWSTGGASVWVVILAFESGTVRQVLTEGSDWLPELVVGTDGQSYVLFNFVEWEAGERSPRETLVYRWDGREYQKKGRVPFAKRFDVVLGRNSGEVTQP